MSFLYDGTGPIILGIGGEAGSGKTTTANIIAPMTQNSQLADASVPKDIDRLYEQSFMWDHKTFAAPISKIASIKSLANGLYRADRILYGTHKIISDLFLDNPIYGAPPYEDLVSMVQEISSMRIDPDDPRTFYNTVTEMCKDKYPKCFAIKGVSEARADFVKFRSDYEKEELRVAASNPNHLIKPFVYTCVFSDAVGVEEVKKISKNPFGLTVYLDLDHSTRLDRLLDREDGSHRNIETNTCDKELYDIVIDVSGMNEIQVALEVRDAILDNIDWDM